MAKFAYGHRHADLIVLTYREKYGEQNINRWMSMCGNLMRTSQYISLV